MKSRAPRRIVVLLASAACVASLLPGHARAQAVAHFAPPRPAASGERVLELRVVRERAGQRAPLAWPERDVGWLFVREEGAQRNYDALAPASADPTLLRLEREGDGVALVGWNRPPRVERVPSTEVRAFLAARSTLEPMPSAVSAALEREEVALARVESLACIVRPSEAAHAGESAIAVSKSGLACELRALFDPTFLRAGSDYAFRLHLPEGGEEGALVARAVHLASGETRVVEIGGGRVLRARLDRAGAWMLEAHRLRRAPESGSDAELELASGTIVFEVRAADARGAQEDGR